MYLAVKRLGNAAWKASLSQSQARKTDRVFIPSAVILTLSGLSLSVFGLHQLDSSHRLLAAQKRCTMKEEVSGGGALITLPELRIKSSSLAEERKQLLIAQQSETFIEFSWIYL